MVMTYEYIAGFFDGEGSTGVTSANIPYASVSQARRNNAVLYAVNEFLLHNGIHAGIYHIPGRKDCFKETPMSTLKLNRIESLILFLQRIRPFSIVKSKDIDSVLAFCSTHEFVTKSVLNARLERAISAYQAGMGAAPAAKAARVAWKRLRSELISRGIPIRSQSEAKRVWWSRFDTPMRSHMRSYLDKYRNTWLVSVEERLPMAIADYQSGLSIVESAAKHKMGWYTLRAGLLKSGIQIRKAKGATSQLANSRLTNLA
jgi:hypothetical protein